MKIKRVHNFIHLYFLPFFVAWPHLYLPWWPHFCLPGDLTFITYPGDLIFTYPGVMESDESSSQAVNVSMVHKANRSFPIQINSEECMWKISQSSSEILKNPLTIYANHGHQRSRTTSFLWYQCNYLIKLLIKLSNYFIC